MGVLGRNSLSVLSEVLSKAGLAEWNVVKEVFFNGELVETPQRLAEADLDLRGGTLEITYWATAESGSIHTSRRASHGAERNGL